ncbi:MAG: hypothetical protein ABJA78_09600 [Ferruginibacter sp.]
MFSLKIHRALSVTGLACFCAFTVVMLSEQILNPDFFSFGIEMFIPVILVLLLPILFYVFSITWNNKLRMGSHSDLFIILFFLGIIYLSLNCFAAYSMGDQVFNTRETNIFSAFFGFEREDNSPVHLYYFVTSVLCLLSTILSLITMVAIKKGYLSTHR